LNDVVVIGVGMHNCGKHTEKSLKDLAQVAIWNALEETLLHPSQIQAAFVGNAMAGLITGQECVRGQTVLTSAGFQGIPIVNVENACATGATAFQQAWMNVYSGMYDVVLAVGVEKLYCGDTSKSLSALATASDIEIMGGLGVQFTALYAMNIKNYMEKHNVSIQDMARVVVKNSKNGSFNPYAQFKKPRTLQEVMSSRVIAEPVTLLMCSSIADGAAAAILCNKKIANQFTKKHLIKVETSVLRSAMPYSRSKGGPSIVEMTAKEAYEKSGIEPGEIDVVELHDAVAPGEVRIIEELGLCREGEGVDLLIAGETEISGQLPVNPSGGLVARGHPVGATGIAQIAELVWQLRGEAGQRQVGGANGTGPKVGLAENAGGRIESDSAACVVSILSKVG